MIEKDRWFTEVKYILYPYLGLENRSLKGLSLRFQKSEAASEAASLSSNPASGFPCVIWGKFFKACRIPTSAMERSNSASLLGLCEDLRKLLSM